MIRLILSLCSILTVESTYGLTLYVAANGSPASRVPGTSSAAPLSSLEEAQKSLYRLVDRNTNTEDVHILIRPDNYYGHYTKWTFTSPSFRIVFRPWGAGKPKFFGSRGNAGTFFTMSSTVRTRSGLVFNGLSISDYHRAFLFQGSSTSPTAFNSNNEITDCDIRNIGSKYSGAGTASYAAISLVNSRYNRIENNYFNNVANDADEGPELIHAVYMAHFASFNYFAKNLFTHISGDIVKFRDRSNDNLVTDNVFFDGGAKTHNQEWYCHSGIRSDCARKECPSLRNEVSYNSYNRRGFYDQIIPLFTTHIPGNLPSGCVDGARIRTRGNVVITNWSQALSAWRP